jgi:hypothetical protein
MRAHAAGSPAGHRGRGEQGPLERQAASGSARGEGERFGARGAAQGVRKGGELQHDVGPAARVATGERCRARRVAKWRQGKRGMERGGWQVGQARCGAQL